MKIAHHTDYKNNNNNKYKVYALLEPNGMVYIGKTTSLRNRMAVHAHARKTTVNALIYRAIEVNTELQARKIEGFLINEFQEILSNKYGVNVYVRRNDECVRQLKTSIFFNSIINYAQKMSNILKHAKPNKRIGKLVAKHSPEWNNIEGRTTPRGVGRPKGKALPFYMRK